jgi:hypothetical protein
MIFIPLESIAFANCLASLSVGNVMVFSGMFPFRGNSPLFRRLDRNERIVGCWFAGFGDRGRYRIAGTSLVNSEVR